MRSAALFVSSIVMLAPVRALADVAPEPGRPAWDHTPLPVPPELLVASVVVLALALARLALRSRPRQAARAK